MKVKFRAPCLPLSSCGSTLFTMLVHLNMYTLLFDVLQFRLRVRQHAQDRKNTLPPKRRVLSASTVMRVKRTNRLGCRLAYQHPAPTFTLHAYIDFPCICGRSRCVRHNKGAPAAFVWFRKVSVTGGKRGPLCQDSSQGVKGGTCVKTHFLKF